MKKFFTGSCLIAVLLTMVVIPLQSQTVHDVNVSNSFVFNPANLTIEQGDQVVWNNTSGTHNVNGTTATYPNNPISFGNSVASSPWEYSFTFDVIGQYNYQCDPHVGIGMVGSITVTTATALKKTEAGSDGLKVYPQPANDIVFVELDDRFAGTTYVIKLYNMLGVEVLSVSLLPQGTTRLSTSQLVESFYFYQVMDQDQLLTAGKILIE